MQEQEQNKVGKPLRFKTPEELQDAIDEYFAFCDNRISTFYSAKADGVVEVLDPAPYTMAGLARVLGISRQCLSEYSHREHYGDAIKAAREKVHEDVERRLMEKNATGAIFNLKNNFGWRDSSQIEHSGSMKVSVSQKYESVKERLQQMGEDERNRIIAGITATNG